MIPSTIIGLFNNIALLICLGFFYDLLTVRQVGDKSSSSQIITGLILGVIGLAVMLNPWEFTSGVVFDTRSILLCITGFFFGTVPVIITILMTAGYRVYLGGGGLWMGVAVIFTSGVVGLVWRHRQKDNLDNVSWKQLYLMGVVVHVLMLFWTILLPWHVVKNVLANIFLPVLLLYPIGTALLGQLMINRHANKLAKENLTKSEERFNLAMNASKDGLWDWDITTDKVYYSPAYGEMLGYTYSEIPQQVDFWKGLMHPDDRDISLKSNLGCIENKCDNFNIEFRLKMKNGDWKWINSRGKVVGRDNMGRATRMIGTHADISEYKQNAENLKAIFDSAPNVLALVDDEIKVEMMNRKGASLLGKSSDEILGSLCGDVFNCVNSLHGEGCGNNPECSLCPLRTLSQDTFKTGKPHFENEGRMTFLLNGNETSMDMLVSTSLIEISGVKKVLLSLTDITEQKKMETRIQQAQKMESIGNLAGGIAHDFNNLLYPIIGLSEMLIEDLPKNSPENENVKEILKAGKRGSELVKQILAFSRQNEHTLTPVRVQFVMKEVLKLIRASIPMNIEINQQLQSDCGLVLADSTQLHQIGMNLITNAYHAVESGIEGKIDVQVREITLPYESKDISLPPGQYALLSVSDNGVGIDPAYKDKIFEPYFTTKEQGKGTGLGLSMVYGIVKEHKGDIKVYSELGKGTTFNIYIPLMAKSDIVESSSEKVVLECGSEHILLVDDEAAIANLEKQILERLGYTISERTSSFDALEAFKANPDRYDLVISDMSMPHMTGDALARKMLSIKPDLPIIICTGFSERLNKELAKEMGIKGLLMKPVTISDMAQEVRRVLDEKKS